MAALWFLVQNLDHHHLLEQPMLSAIDITVAATSDLLSENVIAQYAPDEGCHFGARAYRQSGNPGGNSQAHSIPAALGSEDSLDAEIKRKLSVGDPTCLVQSDHQKHADSMGCP